MADQYELDPRYLPALRAEVQRAVAAMPRAQEPGNQTSEYAITWTVVGIGIFAVVGIIGLGILDAVWGIRLDWDYVQTAATVILGLFTTALGYMGVRTWRKNSADKTQRAAP